MSSLPETPERRRLRRFALASVVTNAGIVITGGTVRITGSGLGCPTWPSCDGDSFVPRAGSEHAGWQMAIEFGNRLLTFVVLVAVVGLVWQLYRTRPHPPKMVRLAWLLPIGVIGQALVGGVVVLTGLSPYTVMTHFLLSMVLLFAAVAVHEMVRRQRSSGAAVATDAAAGGAVTVRGVDEGSATSTGRRTVEDLGNPSASVRHLTTAVVVVAFLVLIAGTVTTGAGPHGGDPSAPRLALDIRLAALAHADMVWLLLGLTVALVVITWRGPAPLARTARILLGFELLQGVIGYTQYVLGVPEALVVLHVAGAVGVWTAASAVWIRARPELGRVDRPERDRVVDGGDIEDELPPDREAATPR
jgi:heme a synthase